MQTHIFAEDSNTTADSLNQPGIRYYEGLFTIVSGLYDDLSDITDTHLHILSDEYGVISGQEKILSVDEEGQLPVGTEEMTKQAKVELLNVVGDSDVMIILLSTDVFQNTVVDVWDELVDMAKPESTWCLGAARSSLESIKFDGLEAKDCTVLTYQRVGVARIGSETRQELLEIVKQKATQ